MRAACWPDVETPPDYACMQREITTLVYGLGGGAVTVDVTGDLAAGTYRLKASIAATDGCAETLLRVIPFVETLKENVSPMCIRRSQSSLPHQ